jgi:hypothetical protein
MDVHLSPQQRIEHFRLARRYNPLELTNRIASASAISDFALKSQDTGWLKAAQIENRMALQTDDTNAEVLEKAILVDLALHADSEAQVYYRQFKRIDRKSAGRAVACDP